MTESRSNDVETLVLLATAGDLDAFRHLEDIVTVEAFRVASLPQLTVGRSALRLVLTRRGTDQKSRDLAERWAFFMLLGYIRRGGSGPTIDTSLDVDADQLVIDILNRVSMHDDLPGPVTDLEIDNWIRSLMD